MMDTWKIELAINRLADAMEKQNKILEMLAQNQVLYFQAMLDNQQKKEKKDGTSD